MLKCITFSAIVICLVTTNRLHAQRHIDIGVKGGLSIPNLTGGNSDNPINSGYSSMVGPTFGVSAEFHITKIFSIQPELDYCAEGGKKDGYQAFSVPAAYTAILAQAGITTDYLYANYKSKAKFNYILLPILAKFHIVQKNKWDIYAAAGPFVGLLASAKDITNGNSDIYLDASHSNILVQNQSFDNKEDIKDQIHKFNTGVDGFVGIGYHIKRSIISIEGGGNYGFINIQKGTINGKNNMGAGALTLGYAYALSK